MSKNPTIQAYDRFADVYDKEVIVFWNEFPKEFLQQFAANLPGKRVLNVGSGSGRDALLLRELGLDVVCIDGSSSMIEMTKKLGFESHLLEFSEISFPSESVDGIWAYTSLIHISKDTACAILANLCALLKTGGLCAIGVIDGTSEAMVERTSMPDARRYFRYYSREEIKEMVEPLGFAFQYEKDYRPHNNIYINQIFRKL
jgi:ubiquinone/menaquinone biosynthesis C-methylase UbiE